MSQQGQKIITEVSTVNVRGVNSAAKPKSTFKQYIEPYLNHNEINIKLSYGFPRLPI